MSDLNFLDLVGDGSNKSPSDDGLGFLDLIGDNTSPEVIESENNAFNNSLIQQYRSTPEGQNDKRTNRELTQFFADQLNADDPRFLRVIRGSFPDFENDLLTIQNEQSEGLISETAKGLGSAFEGLKGIGKAGLAIGADILPGDFADPARDALLESANENFERAAEGKPTVSSLDDIRSFGEGGFIDTLRFVAGGTGSALPSAVEAIVSGGIGATLGKSAVKTVAKDLIRDRAASKVKKDLTGEALEKALEEVGDDIARSIGQNSALLLNSYTLSAGEIYAEAVNDPDIDNETARNTALLFGAVAAAPDTVMPNIVLNKFRKITKGADTAIAKKRIVEGRLREAWDNLENKFSTRIAKGGAVAAFTEGPTEAFQEFINIVAIKTAKGEPLDFSEEEFQRMLDAGAIGALGGGAIGMGSSSIPPRFINPETGETIEKPGSVSENERVTEESANQDKLFFVELDIDGNGKPQVTRSENYNQNIEKSQDLEADLRDIRRVPKREVDSEIDTQSDPDINELIGKAVVFENERFDSVSIDGSFIKLENSDISIRIPFAADPTKTKASQIGISSIIQTPSDQASVAQELNEATENLEAEPTQINQGQDTEAPRDLSESETVSIAEPEVDKSNIEPEPSPTNPDGTEIVAEEDSVSDNPVEPDVAEFVDKYSGFDTDIESQEVLNDRIIEAYQSPGSLIQVKDGDETYFYSKVNDSLAAVSQIQAPDSNGNEVWMIESLDGSWVIDKAFKSKTEAQNEIKNLIGGFDQTSEIPIQTQENELPEVDVSPVIIPGLSKPVKDKADIVRGDNISTSVVPLQRKDSQIKQWKSQLKKKSLTDKQKQERRKKIKLAEDHAGKTLIALSKDGQTYITRAFRPRRNSGSTIETAGWKIEQENTENFPGFNYPASKKNPDLTDFLNQGFTVSQQPFEVLSPVEDLFIQVSDSEFNSWFEQNIGQLNQEKEEISDVKNVMSRLKSIDPEIGKGIEALIDDAVSTVGNTSELEVMAGFLKNLESESSKSKVLNSKDWKDFIASSERTKLAGKKAEDFESALRLYAKGEPENARIVLAGAANRNKAQIQIDRSVENYFQSRVKHGVSVLAETQGQSDTFISSDSDNAREIQDTSIIDPRSILDQELAASMNKKDFERLVKRIIASYGNSILETGEVNAAQFESIKSNILMDLNEEEYDTDFYIGEETFDTLTEKAYNDTKEATLEFIKQQQDQGREISEITDETTEFANQKDQEIREGFAERISRVAIRYSIGTRLENTQQWIDSAVNEFSVDKNALVFSKPSNANDIGLYRLTNSSIRSKFNFLKEVLSGIGVNVTQIERVLDSQFNGVYDQNSRIITLSMEDMINANAGNLKALTHEIVHALYRDLPPSLRNSINDGVSDFYLNGNLQYEDDGSIASAKTPELKMEELLAASIQSKGILVSESKGIARAIIRLLKDWMISSARVFANLIGLQGTADRLSVSWFNNRVDQILNGDPSYSIFNELGTIPFKGANAESSKQQYLFQENEFPISVLNGAQYNKFAPMDSEQSFVYNINMELNSVLGISRMNQLQSSDVAFSFPAQQAGREIDRPEVGFHQVISVANAVERIKDQIAVQMNESPEFQEIVNSYNTRVGQRDSNGNIIQPKDARWVLNNSTKFHDLRNQIAKTVSENPGAPIDPNFVPEMFESDGIREAALERVVVTLNTELRKLETKLQRDLDSLESSKNKLKVAEEKFEIHKDYLDAEMHTRKMRDNLRKSFREFTRNSLSAGAYKGMIMEQIKQLDKLDTDALVRKYRASFNQLIKRDFPEKFFTYVDTVVEEVGHLPRINISEYRKQIENAINANQLSENSNILKDLVEPNNPNSTVLLSSVVSFLKTDAYQSSKIQLRKEKNPEKRLEIQQELNEIFQASDQIAIDIVQLSRNSRENGIAYNEYLKAKRDLAGIKRTINRKEQDIKIENYARDEYQSQIDSIAASIGITSDFELKDGALYFQPDSIEDTASDLKPKVKPLQISSTDTPTSKKSLRDDLIIQRQWLEEQKRLGLDNTVMFNRVQQQLNILTDFNEQGRSAEKDSASTWISMLIDGFGQVMASTGLISGQNVQKLVNTYTANRLKIKNGSELRGRIADKRRKKLLNAIRKDVPNEKIDNVVGRLFGARESSFKDRHFVLVDRIAKKRFEAEVGLFESVEAGQITVEQAANQIIDKTYSDLESNPVLGKYFKGRKTAIKPALRAHIDAQWDNSEYFFKINSNLGIKTDINIKSEGLVGAVRRGRKQSLYMFSRSMNNGIRIAYDVMTKIDRKDGSWHNFKHALSDVAAAVEATRDEENPVPFDINAIKGSVNKFFNDSTGNWNQTIRDVFVDGLMRNNDTAVFNAPSDEYFSIETRPADTEKVKQAWAETLESDGDIVDFITILHDLHGGQDLPSYIADSLGVMSSVFNQLNEVFGEKDNRSRSYKSIASSFQIESRTLGPQFPETFHEYIMFGSQRNDDLVNRTAFQLSFGRDGRDLKNRMDELKQEIHQKLVDYNAFAEKLDAEGIPARYSGNLIPNKTEFEKRMIEEFGAKQFNNLKKLSRNYKDGKRVQEEEDKLFNYFSNKSNPGIFGTEKTFLSFMSLVTSRMLSGPATAMMNFGEIGGSPLLNFGVSPITAKMSANALRLALKDAAGGVQETMGLSLLQATMAEKKYNDLGYKDVLTHSEITSTDAFNDPGNLGDENESPLNLAIKKLNRFLDEFTVGQRGGDFTKFRLPFFGSFTGSVLSASRGASISLWQSVADMVYQAAQAAENDPALLESGITSKDLQLDKASAFSFDKMESLMTQEYNIGSFTDLVKDAIAHGATKNNDVNILSDKTLVNLAGMAESVLVNNGSLSNFNLMMQTGPFRILFLFMGWSLRRTSLITKSVFFNEKNEVEASKRVLGIAFASLVAALIPSLGTVWLQDEYYERLLGKKRNKRGVDDAIADALQGNFAEAGRGFLENAAYGGAYGIYGELLNASVNRISGSGDAQALSLDSRVVLLNSLSNIGNSALSVVHTGGQMDYNKTIRPFMQAIGLNGLMQAEQLLINMTGIDGGLLAPEAATVRRMNAQNQIAASARNLGIELKKFAVGGAITSTPLSAYSSKMERAVYNNDKKTFLDTRLDAIKYLVESGKAPNSKEALKILKSNFARRHPITKIISRKITKLEFQKVLNNMSDTGKLAVVDAIRHYDAFAASLGIKPYFKASKPSGSSAVNIQQLRSQFLN